MDLSNLILFYLPLALAPVIAYLILDKSTPEKNLPPGKTGLPFIGESFSYFLKFRKGRLYDFVKERMDKHSPKVFKTSLIGLGKPVAILGGAEGNKFLFSNENKLVKLWWPSGVDKLFPQSDHRPASEHAGELHKNILPLFLNPKPLRNFLPTMDDVAKQHFEAYWTGNDKIVAVEMVKKYTLALACNFFLGIGNLSQIEDVMEGMEDIESATMSMRINLPGTAWSRGVRASETVRSKIEAIIKQRKTTSLDVSNAKDFITHMLLAVDGDGKPFKDEDIASHLVSMIMAAYPSLQMSITLLINALSDLPSVYESVLKEQLEIIELKEGRERLSWEDIRSMKYSWNVTCEVFRLNLTGLGFKEAITDFTYEGYSIPKGWMMHWLLDSTHRNPKYFKDPEKFDPTRFDGDGPAPYTFVPFGGGPRMCPGNEYSRLAILTFLHYMVTQFSWEKANPNEKVIHFPLPHPAQGLPIRIRPQNSSI